MVHCWLVKSEPEAFSWQDLLAAPGKQTCWDGVRNYQARNYLRDAMKVHDKVLFYQSSAVPLGVVGTMRVVRAGYPDPTQFRPDHAGFDAKSSIEAPRWYAVDLQFTHTLAHIVTLDAMREVAALGKLALLQRGNRLSVQPLPAQAFTTIVAMGAGHVRRRRRSP